MKLIGTLGFLFIISIYSVQAQSSFRAGYSYGYIDLDNFNRALSFFNKNNFVEGESLRNLHHLNGLNIGYSYKSGIGALTLSYETGLSFKNSNYFNVNDDVRLSSKFDLFSAGIEIQPGMVGIGTSLDFTKSKIVFKNSTEDTKQTLVNDNNFGNTIYLNIKLGSNQSTGVAIQPYYRYYWAKMDVSDAQNLFYSSQEEYKGTDRPRVIGLRLLILNGYF